jgi:hypothetical protein
MAFRAADVVKHGPTGEEWVLACDQEREDVRPAGWPETLARASDCTLVEAASDVARLDMLGRVAAMRPDGGRYDGRKGAALRQLADEITCPACGAEAWVNIDCETCLAMDRTQGPPMPNEWPKPCINAFVAMASSDPVKLATWIESGALDEVDLTFALEALGASGHPEHAPLIARHLTHAKPIVREGAVLGLVNCLACISVNDASPGVRAAAKEGADVAREDLQERKAAP